MAQIRILGSQVARGSQDSYFRLRMDGLVRYVTIAGGTYDLEDMLVGERLLEKMPRLPFGNWNVAHIIGLRDGEPYVHTIDRICLPSIRRLWHLEDHDYFDFQLGESLATESKGVFEATSPRLPQPVVLKFAAQLWQTGSLEIETAVYNQLAGKGVGPGFLGHLMEESRPFGFVLEKVTDARNPGPEDLVLCQEALVQLHNLGYKHGEVHRDNFLIRDGRAVLLGLSRVRECEDASERASELEQVGPALQDPSRDELEEECPREE